MFLREPFLPLLALFLFSEELRVSFLPSLRGVHPYRQSRLAACSTDPPASRSTPCIDDFDTFGNMLASSSISSPVCARESIVGRLFRTGCAAFLCCRRLFLLGAASGLAGIGGGLPASSPFSVHGFLFVRTRTSLSDCCCSSDNMPSAAFSGSPPELSRAACTIESGAFGNILHSSKLSRDEIRSARRTYLHKDISGFSRRFFVGLLVCFRVFVGAHRGAATT